MRSTFDRWDTRLADAKILAPSRRSLLFELVQNLRCVNGMARVMARNDVFQKNGLELLKEWDCAREDVPRTLFAFSYAARELFRYAKSRGWRTVLGQIDPGPEEENLVLAEHRRYPNSGSKWQAAGDSYWEMWREETDLADRIIVNSEWARDGLLNAGVAEDKIEIIPLFCDRVSDSEVVQAANDETQSLRTRVRGESGNLQVLFLGNVCLRKGIGRLIDAMHLLVDEPIDLVICGHLEVSEAMWSNLPNVRWMGPVPNSGVSRTYRSADVFILPTISDGFARTQIESMANGTPVITSEYCGNVVVDGINGFRLKENSPEEIAALLRKLCRDRSILSKLNMEVRADSIPTTLADLERLLLHPEACI